MITAATIIALAGGASAAVKVEGDILTFTGNVTPYAGKTFVEKFTEDISHVKLESQGGDVETGYKMIEKLREYPEVTTEAIGDCLSMCAAIWLSADKHIHNEKQRLGFHMPYTAKVDYIQEMVYLNGLQGLMTNTKIWTTKMLSDMYKSINNKNAFNLILDNMVTDGSSPHSMWFPEEADLIVMEGPFKYESPQE